MTLEEEIKQQRFKSEWHKLAVNVLYTHGWLVSRLSAALKPHGLTIAQFNILRILRGQHPKPATISLLQERMLDKMSDTSRLVERLRGKGLVERSADTVDRRRVAVRITDEGLRTLDVIGDFEEALAPLSRALTEERALMINEALDSMRGGG
ncbi:MAG: MarR family transcriptional regulator [Bacteroidota bacterium]|nr:MarR family transcriptional regulator [Bacteroidota bacterium]